MLQTRTCLHHTSSSLALQMDSDGRLVSSCLACNLPPSVELIISGDNKRTAPAAAFRLPRMPPPFVERITGYAD
jgi:hypothetical protein